MNTLETFLFDYHCAATKADIERNIYKYTECGAWIEYTADTVTVGTIVEGSDAEFSFSLTWPFTPDEYTDGIEEIEALSNEAWIEANR